MKRSFAALLLFAVLALPMPAASQAYDGTVQTVTFEGYTPHNGFALPFYRFSINGLGSGGIPGTPYWDFFCVDNLNSVSVGYTYTARFTSIEAGDLSYTREGSDVLVPRTSKIGAPFTTALENYRVAAYLYLVAAQQNNSTTAGKNALVEIQKAAWYATNKGYYPSYTLGDNPYYEAAQAAVAGGWTASNNFYVVTATADMSPGNPIVSATGGTQEYLVYATPEPGTMVLLATGLLGLGVAARRRRKLTDLDDTVA